MTISNSNLANFSDAAVFVHPDAGQRPDPRPVGAGTPGASLFPARSTTVKGEGVVLFMVNNTITQLGRRRPGQLRDRRPPPAVPSPIELVLLNNTFYNNPIGLHTERPGIRAEHHPVQRLGLLAGDGQHLLQLHDRRDPSPTARSSAARRSTTSSCRTRSTWPSTAPTARLRRGTSVRSSATPSSSTRPTATSSSWPTRRPSTRRGAKSARSRRATRSSRPSPRCSPPSAASAPTPRA